jgi:hypothetical protein
MLACAASNRLFFLDFFPRAYDYYVRFARLHGGIDEGGFMLLASVSCSGASLITDLFALSSAMPSLVRIHVRQKLLSSGGFSLPHLDALS